MKLASSIVFVYPILLCGVMSCELPSDQPFEFYRDNPVQRAIGFAPGPDNGRNFDVGVAVFRQSSALGGATDVRVSMAFDKDHAPAMTSSAAINGVALSWVPYNSQMPSTGQEVYTSEDKQAWGQSDTVEFSYAGFDGDSFTGFSQVTPDFGTILYPDSIDRSQGCTIKYSNAGQSDSIRVFVNSIDTDFIFFQPDTGIIYLQPNQLPKADTLVGGYQITWSRTRWSNTVSSKGKKIGIWSVMESPHPFLPAKK